jgi:GNAT superfamily N-acetyltransferase
VARPDKLHEVLEKLPRDGLELRLAERNETPLIWAVSEGYHDVAVTLIEAGADLDAKNVDGNTPLIRAACEGRTELASVLVKVGADLDAQNEDGYSALILAKRRGHLEIVDLLLAAGADRTLVTDFGTTYDDPGHSPKISLTGRRDAGLEAKIQVGITRWRDGRAGVGGRTLEKYVNLEEGDRFVPTSVLRAAYVRYAGSVAPSLPNYVSLEDDLELGIVSSAVPEIARAISSLLCRSLEDARDDRGGYIPAAVVRRVQLEIISPHGVAHTWGVTGHRFVLSRPVGDRSEILATILVGRSKDTIFFFTGRYNNLRHSTIDETVDFAQPDRDDPSHKWFDRFWFPEVTRFKPRGYHHIANFVVSKEQRGQKISRLLLGAITEHYARDHILAEGRAIGHSQHVLCGRGFWQIGDPPWLARMEKLGFYLRWGAESFFVEQDWAPLPKVLDRHGVPVDHVAYNTAAGITKRYAETTPRGNADEHLMDRVPEVLRRSADPRCKLQYFQAMFDF